MKKILTLCLTAVLLLTAIPLSGCNKEEPKEEAPTSMVLVKDSVSEYTIVRAKSATKKSPVKTTRIPHGMRVVFIMPNLFLYFKNFSSNFS